MKLIRKNVYLCGKHYNLSNLIPVENKITFVVHRSEKPICSLEDCTIEWSYAFEWRYLEA